MKLERKGAGTVCRLYQSKKCQKHILNSELPIFSPLAFCTILRKIASIMLLYNQRDLL